MDRWATKTPGEREDEEAERLSRPAPKKKPPRRDKRRERVDLEPEKKQDPDLSLNYKQVGGSLLRRWAAQQEKIPAKSRETGKVVFISPDTLKQEPGKYEPIKDDGQEGGAVTKSEPQAQEPSVSAAPKPEEPAAEGGEAAPEPKKEKPKDTKEKGKGKSKEKGKSKGKEKGKKKDDGAPSEEEEEKEPSEAEKAGIQPPKRPEPSVTERMASIQLLLDTFPADKAAELIGKSLHPEDVHTLVATYNVAKTKPVRNPEKFAKEAADFFELDTDKVQPPASWRNADGEVVAFKSLPPEEQSEAMRVHQMRTVALSMAAQDQLTDSLSFKSATGRSKIPEGLAHTLATFLLKKGDEAEVDLIGGQLFNEALRAGAAVQMREAGTKDGHIQKLFKKLPPQAQRLAQNYFQAADYGEAKLKFLGVGKDEGGFDEHSNPGDIARGIRKSKDFFAERQKFYGNARTADNADERKAFYHEAHPGEPAFKVRVMERLRSLEPRKYRQVRAMMDRDEAAEYKKAFSRWEKDHKAWESRKKAWENKHPGAFQEEAGAFDEPEPKEPLKPPRFALTNPKESKSEADDLWKEMQMARTKVASRVARRFISTCNGGNAMGQKIDKSGVYHGVNPMDHYPPAYPGGQQAHQRDLGEADWTKILSSAREWLKAPVLSQNIEGATKDQQYRAALDLAIQRSPYLRQIQPPVYDMLLARLAGVPEPGLGETLTTLTARADSVYPNTLKKVHPMKASHEVRKMAAVAADSNPTLAYDLVDLADRLAAQEQDEKKQSQQQQQQAQQGDDKEDEGQQKQASDKYAALRSFVIRQASSDMEQRKVLAPVLQKIKDLG